MKTRADSPVSSKAVGQRIRKRRLQLKLTQLQLAGLARVHVQTIYGYEKGRTPDGDELVRLAGALGINAHEILTGEPSGSEQLTERTGVHEDLRLILRKSDKVDAIMEQLRTSPELIPWVTGLLKILTSRSVGSRVGIEENIQAFLVRLRQPEIKRARDPGGEEKDKKAG